MDIKELTVGDVVILKSGGLPMTVCVIRKYEFEGSVDVMWQDTIGNPHQRTISNIDVLTYAKDI